MAKLLDFLWKPRGKVAVFFVLATLIFMFVLFPRAARLSGSQENQVRDLQKAFTTQQFEKVLTTWDQRKPGAVEIVKWENIIKLDSVFPAVYSWALVLTLAALAGGRPRSRWTSVFLIAPFVAAGLDYAENVTHLSLLSGIGTSAQVQAAVANHVFSPGWIRFASAVAQTKYVLILLSILAVAVEAVRRARRPSPVGGAVSFREVLSEEFDYIRRRRFASRPPQRVKETLVGLALSGGGIRAATTCLGMLQALSRLRILPLVDYMCTVSGGGYIGSCLSSLLTLDGQAETILRGRAPMFTTSWDQFPFNPEPGRPGAAQIRHLRTHGSFLLTRKGLLKRETLRSIGQLVSGTVYHLVLAILTLTTIALLYMTLLFRLSPGANDLLRQVTEPLRTHETAYERTLESGDKPKYEGKSFVELTATGTPSYRIPVTYEYPTLWDRIKTKTKIIWSEIWNSRSLRATLTACAAAGFLIALGAFAYLHRYRRITPTLTTKTPRAGESAEDALSTFVLRLAGYGSLVSVLVGLALIFAVARPDAPLALLMPIVMIASLRVTSWLLHIGLPRMDDAWTRDMRSFWGAYQATADYALWTVTVLALIPVLVYAFREHDLWTAVSGLASMALARVLTSRTEIDATKRPVSAALVRWVLALAIGAGLLLLVVSVCGLIVPDKLTLQQVLRNIEWGAVVTLALFVVLSVVGDSNRLSPHYFYRDRLAEAYLYTDEVRPPKTSLQRLRDSMELYLQDLHYEDRTGRFPALTTAPLHLISAAVNLAGSRDLTRKDRKSGYFLFSKFFCGSRHTGFRPTSEYANGEVKLGRAVTISGAAASSGIGAGTFFAQAFASVLFNLRLGFWMPNPAKISSAGQSFNDRWHFWPKWLWREVTMDTDERHSMVNLSDGGHTGDNVGIYPLLQRRCKLIIACDAECDASLTFGSFTEALRHAYIDLGIDVDIDLTMLRPDKETGLSRGHSAVGLIRYPAAPGLERQVGYIVYLKNSLTGDEPEPVLNYKSNNVAFPHESTADQFFDDDQFESYRALGVHIAEHAFAQWVQGAPFERWRRSAEPVAR